VLAAQQAVTRGWRWRAEMEEIASTFRDAGLPDGFYRAAAEIYGTVVSDGEAASTPSLLDGVIEALGRQPLAVSSPRSVERVGHRHQELH
jgi:Domain of unknown function (DUF1932)